MARVADMEFQVMPPSGLPQDQNEWEDLWGRNHPDQRHRLHSVEYSHNRNDNSLLFP